MSDKLSTLLDAQKTRLETVSGIEAANIVFGEHENVNTADDSIFPFVEILFNGMTVSEPHSQREIEIHVEFRVYLSQRVSSPSRDDGKDMRDLMAMVSDMMVAIYGFNTQANNPVPGFIRVEPDMRIETDYQVFDENLNIAGMLYKCSYITDDETI